MMDDEKMVALSREITTRKLEDDATRVLTAKQIINEHVLDLYKALADSTDAFRLHYNLDGKGVDVSHYSIDNIPCPEKTIKEIQEQTNKIVIRARALIAALSEIKDLKTPEAGQ